MVVLSHSRLRTFEKLFPVCAALVVVLACSGNARSAHSRPLGTVLGWGDYALDRLPAPPGTVVFAGDVVATAADSGAELRFLSGGIIRIESTSEVALNAATDEPELRTGGFILHSAAGRSLHAGVESGRLTVDAAAASTCRIDSDPRSVRVSALAGSIIVEGGGQQLLLAAGQSARFNAEFAGAQLFQLPATGAQHESTSSAEQGLPVAPSAAQQSSAATIPIQLHSAGRVVALYPDEVVRHPGAQIAAPMVLGELVNDGDVLGTLGGGRVRVQLFDNSIFDLGAAATLRVVRYDPGIHSTVLELRSGYFSAEVAPAPGVQPNFVVKTQYADVSAATTMFFVSTDARGTNVCNAGAGPLLVRKSGDTIRQAVAVAAGGCSITRAGEAPGASHQDRSLLVREMALGRYEEGPSVPVLARRLAIKKARTATISGASVLSLVAMIEMYQTSTKLNDVASDVQPYISGLTSAAVNLGNAIQLDHQLCLAFLNWAANFGKPISPSIPEQACPNLGP
jgi:ferric-dicitrate binding protein FerR (iron transport regulator)